MDLRHSRKNSRTSPPKEGGSTSTRQTLKQATDFQRAISNGESITKAEFIKKTSIPQCAGVTGTGKRCKKRAIEGTKFCSTHASAKATVSPKLIKAAAKPKTKPKARPSPTRVAAAPVETVERPPISKTVVYSLFNKGVYVGTYESLKWARFQMEDVMETNGDEVDRGTTKLPIIKNLDKLQSFSGWSVVPLRLNEGIPGGQADGLYDD